MTTAPRFPLPTPRLGLGCWAIGGPFFRGDEPLGYGQVDDQESLAAIERALDLGITCFDTADFYGCGHSERLLGQALRGRRDGITLISKFGYAIDETSRQVTGRRTLPHDLEACLDASLARLATDRIDIYLLHLRDHPIEAIDDLIAALERQVERGRIRGYGWSTDELERARAMARGEHCVAIEFAFNVVQGNRDLLRFCEERGWIALARSPLAMGMLASQAPRPRSPDDIRSRLDHRDPRWLAFERTRTELLALLTADGRTPAQGALAWLLARSESLVPLPGFRTRAQVEQNVRALSLPPLPGPTVAAIEQLVSGLNLPPDPLALRSNR